MAAWPSKGRCCCCCCCCWASSGSTFTPQKQPFGMVRGSHRTKSAGHVLVIFAISHPPFLVTMHSQAAHSQQHVGSDVIKSLWCPFSSVALFLTSFSLGRRRGSTWPHWGPPQSHSLDRDLRNANRCGIRPFIRGVACLPPFFDLCLRSAQMHAINLPGNPRFLSRIPPSHSSQPHTLPSTSHSLKCHSPSHCPPPSPPPSAARCSAPLSPTPRRLHP